MTGRQVIPTSRAFSLEELYDFIIPARGHQNLRRGDAGLEIIESPGAEIAPPPEALCA